MGGASRDSYPRAEPKTGATVLVVEDEVLVRMAIADEIRSAGYRVFEASNAHEALQVLRHSPDVRLTFTDIQMPGSIDGIELARLIRSEYPAVKIVLTSGHLTAVDCVGHDGFFPKPYNAAKTIQHFKALLDLKEHVSDSSR
jgi:two-component system, response regulator PdtaR